MVFFTGLNKLFQLLLDRARFLDLGIKSFVPCKNACKNNLTCTLSAACKSFHACFDDLTFSSTKMDFNFLLKGCRCQIQSFYYKNPLY